MIAGHSSYPRMQSRHLAGLLTRERPSFHGVVIGRRREGKTDLLRQVFAILFEKAEGPVPVWYSFDESRKGDLLGRHFAASFCQQARAFLMRQDELLGEPLSELERELERPGLPLSLTELGRDLLAVPTEQRLDFAASLPAQFAHREGRPVCLLLDDVEALGESTPFIPALEAPQLFWLLAGRAPFALRIAGRRSWPIVPLEPFAERDALSLAKTQCGDARVPFVPEVWEAWFDLAGTSPGLLQTIIDTAAILDMPLATIEDLARVYAASLARGTLGSWFSSRWAQALPSSGMRIEVGRRLAAVATSDRGSGGVAFPSPALDSLITEEWLAETGSSPVLNLGMAERDWLILVNATGTMQQREARTAQAFLVRAEQHGLRRENVTLIRELRETIVRLPTESPSGQKKRTAVAGVSGVGEMLRLSLCAIASEKSDVAELFWCYGFQGPRETAESACVLLIALCSKEPSDALVNEWAARLKKEAENLPSVKTADETLFDPGQRHQLWLLLPPDASLHSTSSERRMRWNDFMMSLEGKTPSQNVPSFAATIRGATGVAAEQGRLRLTELEARAQWLEEELESARAEFLKQVTPQTAARASGAVQDLPANLGGVPEPSWRAAMTLGLLLVSADLLALNAQSSPEMLEAVRTIQSQSRKLLEALKRPGEHRKE